MDLFVARQPILDAERRVIGYELLLRAPGGAAAQESLTAAAVADALLSVGIDTLVGDRLAFVDVDDPDTVEDFAGLLPPGRVVLEIDASWPADAARIEKYRGLRRSGYALAADRFPRHGAAAGLLGEFDFVKVEAHGGRWETPERRASSRAGGPTLIALDVNSVDELAAATAAQFSMFQGRCFGRAASRTAHALPAEQWNCLNSLAVVSQPDVTVLELERVVKADAGLSLRLLRTANSAGSTARSEVRSIREALILLGLKVVRHWLALWFVRAIGKSAHSELLATATIRAHCCDALASNIGDDGGFIVGLCSPLDEILQQPMAAVLEHMPLAADAQAALMGEQNHYRHLLEAVMAYERGDWERCREKSESAGADVAVLPHAYAEALRWHAEAHV